MDTVIIGAGVVGLAVARRLAASRQVVVLEQERHSGEHLSSRNSEVIHAGLYYPPGSLKARLCLEGNERLYRYCLTNRIPHRRCGKLVVAGAGQEDALEALYHNARDSGADGLELLPRATLANEEPWLNATAALLSKHSGIIDSHALLQQLAMDAENRGTLLAFRHRVQHVHCPPGDFELTVESDDGPFKLRCRQLILAAGLGNVPLLHQSLGFPAHAIPEQRHARGNYFSLHGRSPTQRLIYPLPEEHGLGVHLTVDLAGQARFGPDVEWINVDDPPDYRVNENRHTAFVESIRRYWPRLEAKRLSPSYAGIRPKLFFNDQPVRDFLIQTEQDHGLPGLINLLGIESPGLTAALALAAQVEALQG